MLSTLEKGAVSKIKWKNNLIRQQEIMAGQYASVELLWESCRKCSPLVTMGTEAGFLPQSQGSCSAGLNT